MKNSSYNPAAFKTFITKLVRQKSLNFFKNKSGKLLDIGCGNGLFLSKLAEKNPGLKLYGIDNDPVVLEIAQNYNSNSNKNINLSLQDGRKTIFPDNYFHFITLLTTTINIDDKKIFRQFINEMFRICKPDGKIIIEFRNGANPFLKLKYYFSSISQNLTIKAYTKTEIKRLLQFSNYSSIKFIPVGLKCSLLSLSNLAIIEV